MFKATILLTMAIVMKDFPTLVPLAAIFIIGSL